MSAVIPTTEASRIAQFMGLREWRTIDDLRLVKRVETGLPVSTAQAIAKRIDPSGNHLVVYDLIPKASYYRRKEQNKPLSKDQSERIFALTKVFAETLRQYHNDHESAFLFLSRKHPLLDGQSPLDVARYSTAGADLVLKILDKAEAGVAA